MQSTTISATALFAPVAEQIRRTSLPTPRGEAIAVTLEQLALLARPDQRYSAPLMRQAYLSLASHAEGETPQVAARRATCLEIADAIGAAHNLGARPGPGARADVLAAVLPWWATAAIAPGDHPRWISIRETAARELAELERAVAEARPAAPTGPRLLELVRVEVEVARTAKMAHAWIDLGVDPMEGGRDGGPVVRTAIETLRGAGYTVELDGRSGQLMVEVDTALRPIPSRRERPGTNVHEGQAEAISAAMLGDLAVEAVDAFASALRSPSGDARRDQVKLRRLEGMMTAALEELPGDAVKGPIAVIMAACELSASEAPVLAEVLIAVKPALARAAGVSPF